MRTASSSETPWEWAATRASMLRVGGTAERPTLRGTMTLDGGKFGDFNAPFLQGVVDYADRRLETDLLLWRSGKNVLDVGATLPLDLALRGAKQRQVDGPLSVHARGDSVDLGILEALTPAIRQVTGEFSTDVNVTGTWEAPRLIGSRWSSATAPCRCQASASATRQ